MVRAEEEENPALYLARMCTLSDDDNGPSLRMASVSATQLLTACVVAPMTMVSGNQEHVDLMEERMFPA